MRLSRFSGCWGVVTDRFIHKTEAWADTTRSIAMLIEPDSGQYQKTLELLPMFRAVLSYDKDFVETCGSKGRWYPFGGSWIAEKDWCIPQEKTKPVSMIISRRNTTTGQKMRQASAGTIARLLASVGGMGVDIWGDLPFKSKVDALRDYQYSVVVESHKPRGYFSEKIIDCFSQGVVPIYWGCPDIKKYFRGILTFETMSELQHILISVVSDHDYKQRREAIKENFERAKDFACCEDWIAKNYADLIYE